MQNLTLFSLMEILLQRRQNLNTLMMISLEWQMDLLLPSKQEQQIIGFLILR